MKKYFVFTLLTLVSYKTIAQDRAITTAVPFLLIAADPRSASMGDQGVATAVDSYSQQWNPAKYAFSENKQGVGITYTPYLSKLVNDVFLGNISYFNKINERSAIGASLRYFSNGEIYLRQSFEEPATLVKPNEFAIDFSYTLKLSEDFALAIGSRFINSDLKLFTDTDESSAARTIAMDIAGFYESPIKMHRHFDGKWRAGFNISNIGPKLKYDKDAEGSFLPTNLALGLGYDFILDSFNKISLHTELNKLLVPTPPKTTGAASDKDLYDTYNDIGWFEGIFKAFGKQPDGFSELMKEVTWAVGAEYWYDEVFALRAGYFNESEEKGARKFFSIGTGIKYSTINLDVSYLFATSDVNNPIEGTLRFGISFNLGERYYNVH